ncbi:MAG: hypothetical protein IPK82_22975 [Polyangiaceae bacterium]|nr:hypothetical protein [Polyangiaceae bacterium]
MHVGHTGAAMVLGARGFAAKLVTTAAMTAAASVLSCAAGDGPIFKEPLAVHETLEAQGARAGTFTFTFAPLGFKAAVAYPEEGHFCVIIPENAIDPASCMGLDIGAMTEALPQGPERPFGVALARMGDWSYIVMLSPIGSGIESKEQIDKFVSEAAKPDPDMPDVTPKLVGPKPDEKYEIARVNNVPVVKFRVDAGVPKGHPNYDVSTLVNYAAFGGKTAMLTFITNPTDVDKVMPFAEASLQSLELPANLNAERFGKPEAELNQKGLRLALTILGRLWRWRWCSSGGLAKATRSIRKKGRGATKSRPAKSDPVQREVYANRQRKKSRKKKRSTRRAKPTAMKGTAPKKRHLPATRPMKATMRVKATTRRVTATGRSSRP